MNNQKVFYSLGIVLLGVILVSVFWKQPSLLSLILIVMALIKHFILPIRYELVFFVVIGLLGAVSEGIIIHFGAWSYSMPQLIDIPFWLPLLWGLSGITAISLYLGISRDRI